MGMGCVSGCGGGCGGVICNTFTLYFDVPMSFYYNSFCCSRSKNNRNDISIKFNKTILLGKIAMVFRRPFSDYST